MHLKKVLHTTILAIAGICMLSSCSQSTTPEVDNSALDKLNLVKEKITLPSEAKDGDTLILKNEENGVKITWESSDLTVIPLTGKITAKFSDTTVKLTAKLKIDIHTATKEFAIKVIGKPIDSATLKILEEAKKTVVTTFEDSNTQLEYTLPKSTTKSIQSKNVIIKAEITSDSSNVVDNKDSYLLKRDLVDQTINVDYTFSLDGATVIESKTIAIPKITSWVNGNTSSIKIIDDNTFELKNNSNESYSGEKYSYILDTVDKKITPTFIGKINYDNSYQALEDLMANRKISLNNDLIYIEKFENNKTYEGAKTYYSDKGESYSFRNTIRWYFEPELSPSEDPELKSQEEKNKAAANLFDAVFKRIKRDYNLEGNTVTELKKYVENNQHKVDETVKQYFVRDATLNFELPISYSVENNILSFKYDFVPELSFYKQPDATYIGEDNTMLHWYLHPENIYAGSIVLPNAQTFDLVINNEEGTEFLYIKEYPIQEPLPKGQLAFDNATKELTITLEGNSYKAKFSPRNLLNQVNDNGSES